MLKIKCDKCSDTIEYNCKNNSTKHQYILMNNKQMVAIMYEQHNICLCANCIRYYERMDENGKYKGNV